MKEVNHEMYKAYKARQHDLGWNNKLITLNQDNDICNFIIIKEANIENTSSEIIVSNFRNNSVITVDASDKYIFKLHIIDENGIEIPDDTEIRIIKHATSADMITLTKICYSEIKNGYIFKEPFKITTGNACYDGYHIDIYMSNNKIYIPKENIKFEFTFDYWTRND